MSNNLAVFHAPEDRRTPKALGVTAFVDSDLGKPVQLTIGSSYAMLSEQQIEVLIAVLQSRIDGDVTATGSVRELGVPVSGTLI